MSRRFVALGVLPVAFLLGCTHRPSHQGGVSPTIPRPRASASLAHVTSPRMLQAHRLSYLRRGGPAGVKGRGQPVPRNAVTGSVALRSGDLVGLADVRSYFGRVYLAISRDGGRTWAIDSPLFYFSAAHGAATTTALARTPSGLVVAWGHGGNFVKVTQDKGASWFETDFLDGVDTLIVSGDRLIVHELQFTAGGAQLPDLTYISNAAGRTWQLEGRA